MKTYKLSELDVEVADEVTWVDPFDSRNRVYYTLAYYDQDFDLWFDMDDYPLDLSPSFLKGRVPYKEEESPQPEVKINLTTLIQQYMDQGRYEFALALVHGLKAEIEGIIERKE